MFNKNDIINSYDLMRFVYIKYGISMYMSNMIL